MSAATTNFEHQTFDKTHYKVWLVSAGLGRNDTIVKFALAMSLDLKRAREIFDAGEPFLRNATIHEVRGARSDLRRVGLDLRTEPRMPPWPGEESA